MATLADERARLVRLCARLVGDADAAEDLAQDTLYMAWRDAHRLRDPARRPQWLAAIARHLCQDWLRRRGRETVHLSGPRPPARADGGVDGDASPAQSTVEEIADDFDLEVEFERRELADLLDRALALLPPGTRAVLVQRYLDDTPQSRVALRRSAHAVGMASARTPPPSLRRRGRRGSDSGATIHACARSQTEISKPVGGRPSSRALRA
jgi:RNA polymerase sigma-70 factor (ECF subfamily)